MSIREAWKEAESESNELLSVCDEIYDKHFGKFFDYPRDLCNRLYCKDNPITTDELETILIDVPIILFEVAEHLSSLQLRLDVLKAKSKEQAIPKVSDGITIKATDEEILQTKLLISAVTSVISRVEREISFSRELIMGAKKLWDSRDHTIKVNPVSEVTSPQLPDYKYTGGSEKSPTLPTFTNDPVNF